MPARRLFTGTNNYASTTVGALTVGTTTIVVAGAGTLPSPGTNEYFLLTLSGQTGNTPEIVRITTRSGTTLTVVRAQEGTIAQAWNSGVAIEAYITAGDLAQFGQGLINTGDALGADAVNLQGLQAASFQVASGDNAVAVGTSNTASGILAVAVGNTNNASTSSSVAVGNSCGVVGSSGTAVGIGCNAGGTRGSAVGNGCTANATDSTAVGRLSTVGGGASNSSAFGMTSSVAASAIDSLAAGRSCAANANECLAVGRSVTVSGVNGIGVGRGITNTGLRAIAIGTTLSSITSTDSVTIGTSVGAPGLNGVSLGRGVGIGGDSAVGIGDGAAPLGAGSVVIGPAASANTASVDSVVIGRDNISTAARTVVIGSVGEANADDAISLGGGIADGLFSIAIGLAATTPAARTVNIAATGVIQDGNLGDFQAGEQLRQYAGWEAILCSQDISLTAAPATVLTLSLPAGTHFFVDEVGLIIAASTGVTSGPTVSYGTSGGTATLLAATAITSTALFDRTRFATVLTSNGQTQLTFTITASAVATTLVGRPYFKGLLVTD